MTETLLTEKVQHVSKGGRGYCMTTKKSTKKHSQKKKAKIVYEEPKRKKDYFFPILLLVVAVIIFGFVSNGTFFFDQFQRSEPVIVEGDQTVLVTVNGEEILQAEIDEYWNRLPPQAKIEIGRDQLLEEFIQERLLLQEADRLGIRVTEVEVDEYITAQLSTSGLSFDQFQILLEQQGTTLERMKDIYARQLTLAKLFESESETDLGSTRAEVEAYYEENRDNFLRAEEVTVRHILIPINEELDEEAARERVADIESQLDEENNENFCDLVLEHTADPGSRSTCGEYTFGRGIMVAEFEEAGFDMEINERRTVKSSFGFHIMLKDAQTDARYVKLDEEIDEQGTTTAILIERILAEEKARAVYEAYIEELRERANIVYSLAKEDLKEEIQDEEASEVIVEVN